MSWETTIFNWLGHGRYNTTSPVLTPASTGELQLDAAGNLKVTVVPTASVSPNLSSPAGNSTTRWSDPTGLAAKGQVSSAASMLYRAMGANEGGAKRWIMVFDATSAPTEGAVPVFAIPVVEGGSFVLDLPRGRRFDKGVAWAASSQPGALAFDGAAKVWLNAEYA